jgi:hypothetical protein
MKMKKLVSTVLIVGLIVFGVYWYFLRGSSEARACHKLGALCGQQKLDQCESMMKKMEEVAGRESVQKSAQCVLDSRTCSAAVGCMVGTSVNALGEFLEGVKRSIEKK